MIAVNVIARRTARLTAACDRYKLFDEERGTLVVINAEGDEIRFIGLPGEDAQAIADFINERAAAKANARPDLLEAAE